MTEIKDGLLQRAFPMAATGMMRRPIPSCSKATACAAFAPVQVKGARDGSGNLTITWKRRTRWYGEWQDGTDVPLFEASENYEIDILSGTTVKRTITATTPSRL
jgi:hypothetical protein